MKRPLVALLIGIGVVSGTGCVPPPAPEMSPGCYRVEGLANYPDVYFDGPIGVFGNAHEHASTDGSCSGERTGSPSDPAVLTVVRAASDELAGAACQALPWDFSYALRLAPGVAAVPPADAFYCFSA